MFFLDLLGPGRFCLKDLCLECVDLAEISILPVLFLENLDSRIEFARKSSDNFSRKISGQIRSENRDF